MTPAHQIMQMIAQAGQMKIADIIRRSQYGSAVARKVVDNARSEGCLEKVKISGFVHYRITELGRAYVWHHLGE